MKMDLTHYMTIATALSGDLYAPEAMFPQSREDAVREFVGVHSDDKSARVIEINIAENTARDVTEDIANEAFGQWLADKTREELSELYEGDVPAAIRASCSRDMGAEIDEARADSKAWDAHLAFYGNPAWRA